MGRPRKSVAYLTSDEIYDGWKEWKQTGVVSDDFAKKMILISRRMLDMPQFNGYPDDMKNEMQQEACLKIIRNLKNMREEKHGSFFSYWSTVCYSAYLTYLRNHYKMMNRRRRMLLTALEATKDNPKLQAQIQNASELIKALQEQVDFYSDKKRNDE